jgi:hypothetical protein
MAAVGKSGRCELLMTRRAFSTITPQKSDMPSTACKRVIYSPALQQSRQAAKLKPCAGRITDLLTSDEQVAKLFSYTIVWRGPLIGDK